MSRDSKICCCCRRFRCGALTTDEGIHAPVLHDASQIDYCRYSGRPSLPPITSIAESLNGQAHSDHGGIVTRQNTMTALKYWQGTDIVLQVPLQSPHACDVAGYFHEVHVGLQLSRTSRIQIFYSTYVQMQSPISITQMLYGPKKDTILRRIRSTIY